jgi:hypothetical protein
MSLADQQRNADARNEVLRERSSVMRNAWAYDAIQHHRQFPRRAAARESVRNSAK